MAIYVCMVRVCFCAVYGRNIIHHEDPSYITHKFMEKVSPPQKTTHNRQVWPRMEVEKEREGGGDGGEEEGDRQEGGWRC